jgi:hypothetical protein
MSMHVENTVGAGSIEAPRTIDPLRAIDPCDDGVLAPERQVVDDDLRMAGWPLDRLGKRAELENEQIIGVEIEVTPHYWTLGVIMRVAKPSVHRGQWGYWLKAHGIAKVRAFRARTLAAAFASREELRGLTLAEAMRIATEARPEKPKDAKRKARRRLKAMSRVLLTMQDELKDTGDCASLVPLIDAVAQNLASLRQAVGLGR